MITSKTFRAVDIALKQSTTLWMIPFTWDSAEFNLAPVAEWTLQPQRLFWPTTVWAYTAFLLATKFVHSEVLANDQVKNVMHMIFLIAYCCISIIVLNTVKNRQHIASLFNQYFRFIKKLDGAGHVTQHLDIACILIKSFVYLSYLQSFVLLLMYFQDPGNPCYLYSAVPEDYSSWPLSAIFGLFEYAFYINVWQYTILLFIMLFPYFYGTLYWLREIIYQANRPKRLSPESTYAIYKCFQILTQEFNCCFAQVLLPCLQLFIILIPVMSNHILLRHYNELLPAAVAMLACASLTATFNVFIIFPKAATINSLSVSFVKTLQAKTQAQSQARTLGNPKQKPNEKSKQRRRRRPEAPERVLSVNPKQIRACFALKIRVNSFAYVIRFTTVKIVGLIFYWTARSVLLTRN